MGELLSRRERRRRFAPCRRTLAPSSLAFFGEKSAFKKAEIRLLKAPVLLYFVTKKDLILFSTPLPSFRRERASTLINFNLFKGEKMETILTKLSSDNPEVLLMALFEAETLRKEENQKDQPLYDVDLFHREVEKRLENSRFFMAFSKAVIMHYIMTNI